MDEPFFLAVARQILRDPAHPLSFAFNWYGWAQPMAEINNTPPVLPYLLAGALKISGGGEFWTRACFFPLDLAAAWSLLALASRFLKKPLWPVLIVLAGPAWALNLHHAMAERVMAGFAFPALWLAVVAADEADARAFLVSAVLAALALLSKYNALFVIAPALVYGRSRGTSWMRLAVWCAVASTGIVLAQAWNLSAGASGVGAAWGASSQAAAMAWSAPSHRLRALLAFSGGLALPWIYLSVRLEPSRRGLFASAFLCAVLFGPWLDLAAVRPIDRLAGFLFAWGACVSAWTLSRGTRGRGFPLWASWAASVAVLQLLYWAVMARFVAFLLPPLAFGLWERLEDESPKRLDAAGRACFAAAAAFCAALALVDRAYADAQRSAAAVAAARVRPGAAIWFSGHWGLQEYLLAAGARQLDARTGGWDSVRAGDLVVVAERNTNRLDPARPRLSNASVVDVQSAIPLRLLGDGKDEAGFYSSGMGFLPWALSTAPVETFTFVSPL